MTQAGPDVTAQPQETTALAVIYRIAEAATTAVSLDALFRAIHTVLMDLIPAQNLYLALFDPATELVRFVYFADERDAAPGPEPRKLAHGLTDYILRTGEPLLMSSDRFRDLEAAGEFVMLGAPAEDWLGVPLEIEGHTIGMMAVQSYNPRLRFSSADKDLLIFVSSQIARVIERKQAEERQAALFEAAEQRAAELEALRKASLSLTSSLDLPHVLDAILEHTFELMPGLGNAHVYLYRDDRLAFRAALWRDGRRGQVFSEPRPEGLTYRVARSGAPIVIPDMGAHPLYATMLSAVRGAIVGLPLKIGDRVVGVMNVSQASPHAWTEAELRVLRLLADQAAVAIENAQLHEQIRQHAAELEQRVVDRTAQLAQREALLQATNESLQAAAQQLRALDQMKSQFVANVSHELRTPLTNIKSYLYLLDHGKPEKREKYMSVLNNETALLQRLIEDLLEISRFDLGKARPVLAAVDLNRVVAITVAEKELTLSQRGLTLRLACQADLSPALADSHMLAVVLGNLLTNALNYTPRGGTLTVSTALQIADWKSEIADAQNPQSQISNRQWVTLSVSDTGLGMSADEQTHVFERFYRGEAARQTSVGGTGLGLALCQEIIGRHHGKITVASEVGQGSTFTVWLPVAESEGAGG